MVSPSEDCDFQNERCGGIIRVRAASDCSGVAAWASRVVGWDGWAAVFVVVAVAVAVVVIVCCCGIFPSRAASSRRNR